MKAMNDFRSMHCCQVLFLAHETCEKSLKGGMYAFYGLNSGSLTTHELRSHTRALSSRGGELAQLSQLVCSEIYYLRTRFPNQVGGSLAPVDVYTDEDEARNVASRAEKVYKLIRDSVYNINN
jgi:sacsin